MSTGTQIEVVMPQMGVSVSEGTITKWLKQPGEAIARDEPLLEISTDKVDTEVPSPGDGVLAEILVAEGQTVDVGTVVGRIGPAGGEAATPAPEEPTAAAPAPAEQPAADAEVVVAAPPPAPAPAAEPAPAVAQPAAAAAVARDPGGYGRERKSVRLPRRRAHRCRARRRSHSCRRHRHRRPGHEEGHPRVHRVGRRRTCPGTCPGAGAGCRATRTADHGTCTTRSGAGTDSRARSRAPAAERGTPAADDPDPRADARAACPATADPGTSRRCAAAGETLEPMTAMRRGIAEHMRRSLDTSAHVTSAIEVDMSRVVALRKKLKPEYERAHGVNVTYLAFIARAAVETLKEYPWINGELRGESIVTRSSINLGFAVELADGKGLIVPVLKNSETLNLLGIAKGVADLAERARSKKLLPDEVQGGTFTITNPGGYGTFHGTPVISQPQAGILGTYAVVKRPWVIQDEMGQDVIAIRPIMNLTLTYDHRLVDGALAGRFLRDLRERLESWDEAAY